MTLEKCDPWSFNNMFPEPDPEVTYLEGEEAWLQWDLAYALQELESRYGQAVR